MIVEGEPHASTSRTVTPKAVARGAGAALLLAVGGGLVLLELVTAALFYVWGRQFDGALGLAFLVSAGVFTGLGWLAILAANRLGGWSEWLGRRTSLISLAIVVAAGVLLASGAAWAGQHQHRLAQAKTGGCDAEEISLLTRIPVEESLKMSVSGTPATGCVRTLSVSGGGGRNLLNLADAMLTGQGWEREGGPKLTAPAVYHRDGHRLVVDVAHDAKGRPLPRQGTITLTGG
jgi:hypothetical protein